MKRLPLIALFFLSSCVVGTITGDGSGDSPTTSTPKSGSFISCYDTGYGVKCVQTRTLSAARDVSGDGTADKLVCATDNDKQDPTSQSSDSGPSTEDNDTSDSSDAPTGMPQAMDGESDSDASGESDSESGAGSGCGDSSSTSTSESTTCGASDSGDGSDSDQDSDAVSDSQDCDCVDPDGNGGDPGTGTGGGGTPPTSPGEPPLT